MYQDELSKISVVLATSSLSGVPKVQIELANAFSRKGYDVDLILLTGEARGGLWDLLESKVQVVALRSKRVYRSSTELARYLRANNAGVIIAAELHACIATYLALKLTYRKQQPKFAASIHVAPKLIEEKAASTWRFWAALAIGRFALRRADVVAALTEDMASELSRVFRLQDVPCVTYNPVNIDQIRGLIPQAPERPLPSRYFVYVGRLSPMKNVADIISAFAPLAHEDPSISLVVVGEGALRSELEDLVSHFKVQDRILFYGPAFNPYPIMANALGLISASRMEGFGLVIVEALACGCPVVATACPTGPADILNHGEYGTLVPVGDIEALRDGMACMISSPTDKDALLDRARHFDSWLVADRYLSALGFHRAS